MAVKENTAIDLTQQKRTLSSVFYELAQGYAKLDVSDCDARQRDWIKRLQQMTSDISKRAADTDTIKPGKKAGKSRTLDPAVMQLSADINLYQIQLDIMRRELRNMRLGGVPSL